MGNCVLPPVGDAVGEGVFGIGGAGVGAWVGAQVRHWFTGTVTAGHESMHVKAPRLLMSLDEVESVFAEKRLFRMVKLCVWREEDRGRQS